MPLVKRTIRPTAICRGHLTTAAAASSPSHSELEVTTNGSLACVILQLSSLSQYVEDLFGELHRESAAVFNRTCQLGERVERLKVKITQLNPTVEEVLLQDINMRKPFKSSVIKDQQIMTLTTRPFSIQEIYMRCDPPPALQKLNPYRTDGKDSLKFYTDDGYFFELWRIAMQKESKNQIKKHKKGRQSYSNTPENNEKQATTVVHVAQSRQEQQRPQIRTVEARVQPSERYQHHPSAVLSSNAAQNNIHIQDGMMRIDQNHINSLLVIASNDHRKATTEDLQVNSKNDNEVVSPGPLSSRNYEGTSPARSPASVVNPSPRDTTNSPHDGISRTPQEPTGTITRFSYEDQHVRPVSELSTKSSTPDSTDFLPPPPTPPFGSAYTGTPDSPGSGLPPPPPPPLEEGISLSGDSISDDVKASPGGKIMGNGGSMVANGNAVPNGLDASDGSGFGRVTSPVGSVMGVSQIQEETGTGNKSIVEEETDKVRDTRSDLLAAIREGIQLRKVEERRLKTEKRHRQPGRLDVQTIMETAFEMRRKALEENDSEEGEGDDELDGNWSDDD